MTIAHDHVRRPLPLIDSIGLAARTIQDWTHVNGSSEAREDAR